MLVLSRKVGESVNVGDDASVTVVRVDGDRVRLGFDFPCHVSLARAELESLDGKAGPRNCRPDVTAK